MSMPLRVRYGTLGFEPDTAANSPPTSRRAPPSTEPREPSRTGAVRGRRPAARTRPGRRPLPCFVALVAVDPRA